jgi:hypothetical protein
MKFEKKKIFHYKIMKLKDKLLNKIKNEDSFEMLDIYIKYDL